MARFFTHNGAIGLALTDADLARVPAGAVAVADFDAASNAQLVADFATGYGRFSVAAGALRRDGQPVAFAADSQAKQDLDGLLGAAANALSGNATYLGLASPTNAQVVAQVRALTQQTGAVIRRLVLLNRLQG